MSRCVVPVAMYLQLRAAREAAGLTQIELARRLGVSRGAVGNYETDQRPLPMYIAERWAAACGCRVETLVLPEAERITRLPSAEVLAIVEALQAQTAEDQRLCRRIVLALGRAHPLAKLAAGHAADLLERASGE